MVYNDLPYCDIMPKYAILPSMVMLSQEAEVVKQKENYNDNEAVRIKSISNTTFRRKPKERL